MSDLFTNLCTVSVYIQLYGLVDIHSKYGAHQERIPVHELSYLLQTMEAETE